MTPDILPSKRQKGLSLFNPWFSDKHSPKQSIRLGSLCISICSVSINHRSPPKKWHPTDIVGCHFSNRYWKLNNKPNGRLAYLIRKALGLARTNCIKVGKLAESKYLDRARSHACRKLAGLNQVLAKITLIHL